MKFSSVRKIAAAATSLAILGGIFGIASNSLAASTVHVTVIKYVNGQMATASSAGSQSFPMSATWNDPSGIGSGTGSFALEASSSVPYEATTTEFQSGADYSTNEVTGGAVTGSSCSTGQPYALSGYTSGNSLAAAALATPTA